MTPVRWHRVEGPEPLALEAVARIRQAAREAIEARSRFVIVLAGGETPLRTYRLLRESRNDWARWHVYFSDERCLPAADPNRNSRAIGAAWLDHVPIPRSHCYVIPAELGPQRGAADYADLVANVGEFDVVLLGLGADGHTASLFPGHFAVDPSDNRSTLAVVDAPLPPVRRVTLSPVRLSRARAVIFLVEGATKRAAIDAWRGGSKTVASAIQPPGGVDVLFSVGDAHETAVRVPSASDEVQSRNRVG